MKVVALESASRCAKMRNWFPVLTVLAIIITVPVSSGGAQERPIECCDQVRTPFNDAEVEALDLDDGELFMVPMALIDVGGVGALLGGSSLKATLSDPQTRAKVYSEAVLSAIAAEELSRLEPVAARGPDASDMISAFSTVSSQASDASGIASDVTSGIRAVEAADAARRAGTSISAAQAAEAARFKSSLLGRGSTALGRLTLAANLASNFDDASDRAAFLGEAIRDARISGALSDFEAVLRASPGHDPAMVQGVVDAQTRLTQLSDSRLRRMAEAGAAAFDANQATIAGLVLAKVVSGGAAMVASEVMQLGVSLDDFTAQTISIAAMHNLSAASLAQVKMIADEDTSMLDERELGEIDVRRLGAFQAQLAAEANAATYNLLWTDRWDEPLSFAGLGKALGMTAAEAGSASEDLQERYRDLVAERARTQVDLWIAALPKVGNGGNPSANTGSGISRTSDRVEITGSADSTFLSEVVEVKLGAPVNVVDWREIAEKFEKDGPDFLQPFANEDGKVSGLGVTLDGDPSYSSNRFYFVAVGPVHSNFLSHEIARFGKETLHLGSWYGPYRYLYRTAVTDSRKKVEGALGEANATDDAEAMHQETTPSVEKEIGSNFPENLTQLDASSRITGYTDPGFENWHRVEFGQNDPKRIRISALKGSEPAGDRIEYEIIDENGWSAGSGTLDYSKDEGFPRSFELSGVSNSYLINITAVDTYSGFSLISGIDPFPDVDAGNSFARSKEIDVNTTRVESFGFYEDESDYYRVTSPQDGKLNVSLTNMAADLDLRIYNAKQVEVAASVTRGKANEAKTISVKRGEVYFFLVSSSRSSQTVYTLTTEFEADAD